MDDVPAPRPFCYSCHAPQVACVCAHIRPLQIAHRIVVLRHRHEARRTLNTARLIPLVLPGSRVVDGMGFDEATLASLAAERPALLLYPADDAAPPEVLGGAEPSTIFVVDGTWTQAKGVLNRSPGLRALPAIRIDPAGQSRYRVRKQPRPGCLCTLEAVAELLDAAGERDAATALRLPFEALVDFQLNHKERDRPRFHSPKGQPCS